MTGDRIGENNRIYIRRITREDTDLIIDWRNREEVRKNFFFRDEFTRRIHEKWLKEQVDTGLVEQFIVCLKDNDRPVGSSYLRDIDRDAHTAEYGIFLGEDDARGKGLGYEVLCATMEYALDSLGLKKVIARTISTNIASIRVFEKYGFKTDKSIDNVACSDGQKAEMVMMSYDVGV